MSEGLQVRDRDSVRWITIDRPSSKNGLTVAVNAELVAAIDEAAASHALRVVVIGGASGSFCSGADLKDTMRRGPIGPEEGAEQLRSSFHPLIRAIRAAPCPVLAVVDGHAVGFGCDLALACDIRLVSERARFGEIFVKRGLMPDGGGTYALPRLVGVGVALELCLTGDMVDAEEAVRLGLASRLIPAVDIEDEAWALAIRLAKGPPLVHRLVKEAIYGNLDATLDEALEREVEGQARCLGSADFLEGVDAFLHKREPRFRGE